MPGITIQNSTFARLQRHAKPLVDTADIVISRALDALEQLAELPAPIDPLALEAEHRIDPRMLPSLTHTKVLYVSIEGEPIAKANWNLLVAEMSRRAIMHLGTFEKLRQLFPVNMIKGRKKNQGYVYLPDIDISVQGQDANAACRAVVTAAQELGMALDIRFMWRPREGAAYPGERARLQVTGSKGADHA